MLQFNFAGVSVAVWSADERTAAQVAERAYWDCGAGSGVFVPEYAPTGCVCVAGRPVSWKRVA